LKHRLERHLAQHRGPAKLVLPGQLLEILVDLSQPSHLRRTQPGELRGVGVDNRCPDETDRVVQYAPVMTSGNSDFKDASVTIDQTGRGDDMLSSPSVEHQPASGHRPQRPIGHGCEHHFSSVRTPGAEVDQA
jgi:hypothetical protein